MFQDFFRKIECTLISRNIFKSQCGNYIIFLLPDIKIGESRVSNSIIETNSEALKFASNKFLHFLRAAIYQII